MDTQIEQLILSEIQGLRSELQDFRAETHTWQQEAGERVAALETSMKAVVGNGQPGRLQLVEKAAAANGQAIAALERWKYKTIGMAMGVSGVVTAIAWVVARIVR